MRPIVSVTPCKSIAVPHLRGIARYTLVAVIYLGGYHFSARFSANGQVWNYDGRVNNGEPFLEPDKHDFELCKLSHFGDREAHLYLYAFDSNIPQ